MALSNLKAMQLLNDSATNREEKTLRKVKIFSNLITRCLCICALLFFTACSKTGEIGDSPRTELLLTIRSTESDLDSLIIKVRTIDHSGDEISKSLENRNIITDPVILLILPSSIISAEKPFLLHGIGMKNGEDIVSAAKTLMLESHRRIEREIVLERRTDQDRDGYEPCISADIYGPCDCDDRNNRINPFEREVCHDGIDNNCNGVVDDCEDVM
jgi:hypothetical protein